MNICTGEHKTWRVCNLEHVPDQKEGYPGFHFSLPMTMLQVKKRVGWGKNARNYVSVGDSYGVLQKCTKPSLLESPIKKPSLFPSKKSELLLFCGAHLSTIRKIFHA